MPHCVWCVQVRQTFGFVWGRVTAGFGPKHVSNGKKGNDMLWNCFKCLKYSGSGCIWERDLNLIFAIYRLQATLFTQESSSWDMFILKIEYSISLEEIIQNVSITICLKTGRHLKTTCQTQLFPGSQKSNQANDWVQVTQKAFRC